MNYLKILTLIIIFKSSLIFSCFAQDSIEGSTLNSLYVEFSALPSQKELNQLKSLSGVIQIQRFDSYPSDYFNRLYKVELSNNEIYTKIQSLPFVKSIEFAQEGEVFSIFPSSQSQNHSSDLLFNYQWGLWNFGHAVLRDIDNTHSEKIQGVPGIDIGWTSLSSRLDNLMKRDVSVAILDSGLALEHPDIIDNLYLNKIECINKKSPTDPQDDLDQNDYKGDCIGWDFSAKNEKHANKPYDDVGHGTHLAGIIAANRNNKIGLSGLSNKIKILPIKIYFKNENKKNKPPTVLTDRTTKGILYAIKRGVDVINFSMGWPLAADSKMLRESLNLAHSKGIIVVAAAGNNNNATPVFPCAYENVLCVGAIDIKGEIPRFSNFGGHVDLLAPGDNIISLFPDSGKLTPLQFSIDGYDIMSGTSQASPYISAMAAILKGVFPSISVDEVWARLFSSAQLINKKEKYSNFGLAKLDQSISAKEKPMIVPIFKDLDRITYHPQSKKINFNLKIKNYWKNSGSVQVKIKIDHPAIKLKTDHFSISSLQKGQVWTLPLSAQVLNTDDHSDFIFEVFISTSGQTELAFKHKIIISRLIDDDDPSIITLPIITKEPYNNLLFETIPVYKNASTQPEFFITERNKDSLKLTIFKTEDKQITEQAPLFFQSVNHLLSILKVDINYDGELDYWIRVFGKDENNNTLLRHIFLNSDLKPLYPDFPYFNLKFEAGVILTDMKNLRFLPHTLNGTDLIALPLFYEEGFIPEIDQNIDPFEFEENKKQLRIYYYQPEISKQNEASLKIRLFNNYSFYDQIQKQLNLHFLDNVDILSILPQSQDKFSKQIVEILLSIGQGVSRNYFVMTLNEHSITHRSYELSNGRYTNLILDNHFFSPTILLDEQTALFDFGVSSFSYNTNTKAGVSIFNSNNLTQIRHSFEIYQKQNTDHLSALIQAFEKNEQTYLFYQSKSNIVLHQYGSKGEYRWERPLIRSSFLPGHLFNELPYPVIAEHNNTLVPAIYIDATSLISNHIYLWMVTENGPISPIKLNLDVPSHCKTRNPVPFGEKGVFAMSFLCRKGSNYELKLLPLR